MWLLYSAVPDWRLSDVATDSIDAQLTFILARNPNAAAKVRKEIERTCDRLAAFPYSGRAIAGTSSRIHVSRKYRYRIIYQITDNGILVRDVLHPARR